MSGMAAAVLSEVDFRLLDGLAEPCSLLCDCPLNLNLRHVGDLLGECEDLAEVQLVDDQQGDR